MSGYNNNANDTMQGFVLVMEAKNIPGYYPSQLTSYICVPLPKWVLRKGTKHQAITIPNKNHSMQGGSLNLTKPRRP